MNLPKYHGQISSLVGKTVLNASVVDTPKEELLTICIRMSDGTCFAFKANKNKSGAFIQVDEIGMDMQRRLGYFDEAEMN